MNFNLFIVIDKSGLQNCKQTVFIDSFYDTCRNVNYEYLVIILFQYRQCNKIYFRLKTFVNMTLKRLMILIKIFSRFTGSTEHLRKITIKHQLSVLITYY